MNKYYSLTLDEANKFLKSSWTMYDRFFHMGLFLFRSHDSHGGTVLGVSQDEIWTALDQHSSAKTHLLMPPTDQITCKSKFDTNITIIYYNNLTWMLVTRYLHCNCIISLLWWLILFTVLILGMPHVITCHNEQF